jgi:hypothetical protein
MTKRIDIVKCFWCETALSTDEALIDVRTGKVKCRGCQELDQALFLAAAESRMSEPDFELMNSDTPAERADYCVACGTSPCTHPVTAVVETGRVVMSDVVVLIVIMTVVGLALGISLTALALG